jgi:hypothetical protein
LNFIFNLLIFESHIQKWLQNIKKKDYQGILYIKHEQNIR